MKFQTYFEQETMTKKNIRNVYNNIYGREF